MEPKLLVRQSNGILVYDDRYPEPSVPERYYRSADNPYMLKPILMDCSHREDRTKYIASCGCKKSKMFCSHFKTNVNVMRCMACPLSDGLTVAEGKGC